MDKSCNSATESSNNTTSSNNNDNNTTSSSNRDQYLKHLNKLSHKISKPIIKKQPSFDNQQQNNPPTVTQQNQSQPLNLPQPQPQPQQPPVYNINKSDFRDVVQKLTGSPAHERFSTPPPIQPPKLTSSRLQKIRPPPLPQLIARPPPLLNCGPTAEPPLNPSNPISTSSSTASGSFGRQVQPLSPLPPFPAVHTAAESPISAYMRYLQSSNSNTDSDSKRFAGFSPLAPLVSPRWNNFAQPPSSQQQNVPQSPIAASSAPLHFPMPSSPLPFGCLPSPRSPYPSLFSPTTFQQFPLSPTVPSPRWKGV